MHVKGNGSTFAFIDDCSKRDFNPYSPRAHNSTTFAYRSCLSPISYIHSSSPWTEYIERGNVAWTLPHLWLARFRWLSNNLPHSEHFQRRENRLLTHPTPTLCRVQRYAPIPPGRGIPPYTRPSARLYCDCRCIYQSMTSGITRLRVGPWFSVRDSDSRDGCYSPASTRVLNAYILEAFAGVQ